MAKQGLTDDQYNLRDTLNTPHGRGVISKLLEDLGYWISTYNVDPMEHAKLAGARSVAVAWVEQMERLFPELWLTLQRERLDKINNVTRKTNDDAD